MPEGITAGATVRATFDDTSKAAAAVTVAQQFHRLITFARPAPSGAGRALLLTPQPGC